MGMCKLWAHPEQPMQTRSFLTFRMIRGSILGKRWINAHAPNVQVSRNEVKMFRIQPVSDMVHMMSEVCRPVQVLSRERAVSTQVTACWGVGNTACVCRCVCTGVCMPAHMFMECVCM